VTIRAERPVRRPAGGTLGPSRTHEVARTVGVVSTMSLSNRVVLGLLMSPAHRLLDRRLLGLRLRGVATGRVFELPVMFARGATGLVIYAGRPASKRWWRNLREPTAVEVLTGGSWRSATAEVLQPGTPEREVARLTYARRWHRVGVGATDPLLGIREVSAKPRSLARAREVGSD
jgi:hypothetical protein